MRGLVQDSAIGGRFSQCQKLSNEDPESCIDAEICRFSSRVNKPMSKRFQMVGFRGWTPRRNHTPEIFRFGYRKAANDKMVPDPVGSGLSAPCFFRRCWK